MGPHQRASIKGEQFFLDDDVLNDIGDNDTGSLRLERFHAAGQAIVPGGASPRHERGGGGGEATGRTGR
jgi:hypothetical protein